MLNHAPNWIIISQLIAADIGALALIPAVLLTSLASVVVVLRLYSRARLSKRVTIEDYFVVASLIFSITMTGLIGIEVSINPKRKNRKDRAAPFGIMLKYIYAQSLLYHISINLVKVSILVQYRRIFGQTYHVIIKCANILLFITIACFAWGFFGVLFLCTPIQRYWNVGIPGHCIDAEAHFWSTSVTGIFLDTAIWLLPLPVVGRLDVRARQKVGLGVLFGLGAGVCIVSLLRLVLVHHWATKRDVTKAGTHALIWSTSEINVAIICASLLVMKPLLSQWFPILVGSGRSPTAVHDSRRFKRWITTEMVRNRMTVRSGSLEPAVFVLGNSYEEKTGHDDEKEGHAEGRIRESETQSHDDIGRKVEEV